MSDQDDTSLACMQRITGAIDACMHNGIPAQTILRTLADTMIGFTTALSSDPRMPIAEQFLSGAAQAERLIHDRAIIVATNMAAMAAGKEPNGPQS